MNLKDVFDEQEGFYLFETEEGLDNIQSMDEFLDFHLSWEEGIIELYDGTLVIFSYPDYNYTIRFDIGGNGNFYSHKISYKIDEHYLVRNNCNDLAEEK
jgi:hypothetical protein